MTIDEALSIIEQATAKVLADRDSHAMIQEAVATVRAALTDPKRDG